MDDGALLLALTARVSKGPPASDMTAMFVSASELRAVPLPADENDLRAFEDRVGFLLPPLLRRIYREVANGGFGPGYGIVGVGGGHACSFGTLDPARDRLSRDPRIVSPPPRDRLVVWEFGCGSFACIDATSPAGDVVWLDLERGGPDVFRASGRTLSSCLVAWLEGADLYDELLDSFEHDAE